MTKMFNDMFSTGKSLCSVFPGVLRVIVITMSFKLTAMKLSILFPFPDTPSQYFRSDVSLGKDGG